MIRSEADQPPKGVKLVLKTLLLVSSVIFGIFGLGFFTYKTNFRATSGCLQLVLICALCLHPTCTIWRGRLHETYSYRRFKFIFILAIIVGFIELMASIAYISLGNLTDQEFNFGTGFYVCAIPTSIACVWAFVLTHECRLYMREFGMIEAVAAQVAPSSMAPANPV